MVTQGQQLQAALGQKDDVPALPAGSKGADAQEPGDGARHRLEAEAERENALLWEYRYLNLFLVRGTQLVLDTLISRTKPMTVRLYDSWLSAYIPPANERIAILTALQRHHLVQIRDNIIEVTQKGREYQQWRGPLPPLPPNPKGDVGSSDADASGEMG